jgi:HK97 family phage major capsid protein
MENGKEAFVALNKAFDEFKNANDANLAKRDVVLDEKIAKLNGAIDKAELAIQEAHVKIEAAKLGGIGSGVQVQDPEYTAAFEAHMRKGDIQAAMTKGTASEGGYIAPVEWDRTIIDKLKLNATMRQVAKVQTISTGSFTKVTNNTATASGWVGETAARTATANSAFGSLQFDANELYANISVTQTLLDDALINIEEWIAGEVEAEFANKEGAAFVSGSGTNQPYGLINYITDGTAASRHPFGAISYTASGTAATLGSSTADKILDMVHSLPSKFTANASFIMNRTLIGEVRKLKDTTNQYIWQPSYQAGQPNTLCGYKLYEVSDMPAVGANTYPIAFGDFNAGYLIVDRMGSRVLRDPYSNKPYVQFYVTKRVGGGVSNPEAIKAFKCAAS